MHRLVTWKEFWRFTWAQFKLGWQPSFLGDSNYKQVQKARLFTLLFMWTFFFILPLGLYVLVRFFLLAF